MKNDIKALFINMIGGILSYFIAKFLDNNNLPTLSYIVFFLYVAFIALAAYFHFKNSLKPKRNILKNNSEEKPEKNKKSDKPEIFHKIFQTVAKLSSQHIDATPKIIGETIKENPQIVLAYLNEMADECLVNFSNDSKPADINTSFFIAYHENPWKYLNIKSS